MILNFLFFLYTKFYPNEFIKLILYLTYSFSHKMVWQVYTVGSGRVCDIVGKCQSHTEVVKCAGDVRPSFPGL